VVFGSLFYNSKRTSCSSLLPHRHLYARHAGAGTGSINALIGNAQNNVGIYNDLGDGDSYGTAVVPGGPIQAFSVALSQAAIDDLNAAAHNLGDSKFVIGGSLLSISGPFANEQLFAIFGPQAALAPAAVLDLQISAVPEPSTLAIFLGLGGMVMTFRRKQRGPRFRSL
jgi:hypothetical protein